MNCKKCGQMNPENTKFCLVCGSPLEENTSSVIPVTPTESILPRDINQQNVETVVQETPVINPTVVPAVNETPVTPVVNPTVVPAVNETPVTPVANSTVIPAVNETPNIDINSNQQSEIAVMPSVSVTPNENIIAPAPEKKKSKKTLLIIIAIAVVVIILGVVLILKVTLTKAKTQVSSVVETTTKPITTITEEVSSPSVTGVTYYGLSINVPTGYSIKSEEDLLYIKNKNNGNTYQLYRYNGIIGSVEDYVSILGGFGYTDITMTKSTFMGYDSTVGTVSINGNPMGIMYLDLGDGTILQIYMTSTDPTYYETDLNLFFTNLTSDGTFSVNFPDAISSKEYKSVEITE